MALREKITEDLKSAMREKDKIRLETLRSIKALILEFEKSGAGKEFNEEEEIKMLSTAAKKRKESIEQFRKAGREELAVKEEEELKIIQEYLPKQLNEDEVRGEIKKIAAQIDAKTKEDFSRLMPAVMKELKGKADGKIVRGEVEKFLAAS